METGRYMLRATNTGMTAIVNERGEVVSAAPQFETATLRGKVQGYTGTTPYIRWGNYMVLAISLALIALSVLLSRRKAPLAGETR